ncbi:MFS transporter [Fibrella aquatilis]|uniref:MFS transporter n=1 Tax=Fibrella aquatilis TaxID=2817059 RepID=A0A939G5I7_9BACT|nr:MFS transporter [Fibrella aquatilis]MBO0930411.1 MFS transporter [Fibrella aquatilis]
MIAHQPTVSSPRPSLYTLPFWLLCISNFLFSASFSMMIPELPDYLTSLGGREYLGWVIALFTLTAGLSRPFSGKVTDTVGRVPVMAFGSVVCFFCGLLYPFLITVAGFLTLRLVHGFSTGTKPTATSAYVADVVASDRRGEAMGALGLFTATGMSLGPVIGSFLVNNASMNTMFYTSSVFALLSIGILMRLPETLAHRQPFRFGLLRLQKDEWFDWGVRWPFLVQLLASFASGAVITLAPALSQSVGVANKGWFFAVYTLASLLVRLFFSKSSDRHGRVPVLIGANVILVVSLVMLSMTTTIALFYASAMLYGIAWGMNSPTVQAWTVDLSDEATRGQAVATTYIALEAGIGIGALAAGWFYTHMPNSALQATFGLSAALSAVGVLFLFWVQTRKTLDVGP